MFERLSHEARATVAAAQDVAGATASRSIDTRHLLMALTGQETPAAALRRLDVDPERLRESLRAELVASGIDSEALQSLGIDLAAVRERADAVFGPGALDAAGHRPARIPFTRDAKKALELALREALRLKNKTIGASHVLLGILRAQCPARDFLTAQGIDADALRRSLETAGPSASAAA
ncbi:Clp protease N-terminal domain-containing protein [Leucobacter massiliensis]|uniref:Clp R domain-containing protein n=1 Tax=Leucobacter massiliensis TaxID=1686285 RepID=A0A2S9QRH0_9MICO|nr:Clp protease N-terminal domain-containing protein [Leucobacter massiliensis]PRI12180.1 hypothetical protein B4915_03765 [Leucobacter massiliensis]